MRFDSPAHFGEQCSVQPPPALGLSRLGMNGSPPPGQFGLAHTRGCGLSWYRRWTHPGDLKRWLGYFGVNCSPQPHSHCFFGFGCRRATAAARTISATAVASTHHAPRRSRVAGRSPERMSRQTHAEVTGGLNRWAASAVVRNAPESELTMPALDHGVAPGRERGPEGAAAREHGELVASSLSRGPDAAAAPRLSHLALQSLHGPLGRLAELEQAIGLGGLQVGHQGMVGEAQPASAALLERPRHPRLFDQLSDVEAGELGGLLDVDAALFAVEEPRAEGEGSSATEDAEPPAVIAPTGEVSPSFGSYLRACRAHTRTLSPPRLALLFEVLVCRRLWPPTPPPLPRTPRGCSPSFARSPTAAGARSTPSRGAFTCRASRPADWLKKMLAAGEAEIVDAVVNGALIENGRIYWPGQ